MTKEEAINKIRQMSLPEETMEILQALAPELAESEDERIRKEIIDYLGLVGKGKDDYAQPMIDRWITWIRRQECGVKGMKGPQEVGNWRGDEGVCKKQKEHKPAEKQDYSGLTDFERAIHRGFLCAGVENVPVEIIKETAQDCLAHIEQKPDTRDADDLQLLGFIYDLLNEIKWKDSWAMSKEECLRRLNNYRPQKPAWSKEDESNLQSCIAKIEIDMQHWGNHGKTMVDWDRRLIDWLKSLPERFNLQPKQEWSEEDEELRQSIIKDIKWDRNNTPVTIDRDIRKYDKQINWLKSLRSQSHWKPSEEQMEVLLNAEGLVRANNYPENAKILASLYERLKKL